MESLHLQRELEASSADGTRNRKFSIESDTERNKGGRVEDYYEAEYHNIPTSALGAVKDRDRVRRGAR